MSDPIPPDLAKEIADCIYGGQKIAAIKLLREQSGKSLKDAKEFIEALELNLRAQDPEKFTAKATGNGCLTLFVASGIGTLTVVLLRATILHA